MRRQRDRDGKLTDRRPGGVVLHQKPLL